MKVVLKKEKATITVYLSLILLIILSLIFTIIEGARVSTANIFAERALSTATDSVLADYYGPLWEEYHLFGYDAGNGGTEEKANRLENVVSEYMSYTLTPGKDLSEDMTKGTLNLLGIAHNLTEVEEQTRLMDYEGELFRNEAVEYMKFDTAADVIEVLLDKFSLLEKPKKVSVIYEEKLEAEEKLAEIDRNILRLMELFDGLCTSRKGIKLDRNGKLQRNEYNIKMLYTGEITAQRVSINHDAVFQMWKENYKNPAVDIVVTQQQLKELEELTQQQTEINQRLQNSETELSGAQSQLGAMGSGSNLSKEDKKQRKQIKQRIDECREAVDSLQSERAALAAKKQDMTQAVESECHGLSRKIAEILPLLQEAVTIVEKITESASTAAPLIEKFERRLTTEEDSSLGSELLQELSESLTQMKRYSLEAEGNMGYRGMKDILKENRELLLSISALLNQCMLDLKSENYASCRTLMNSVLTQLSNYRITELSLDYSTLRQYLGNAEYHELLYRYGYTLCYA